MLVARKNLCLLLKCGFNIDFTLPLRLFYHSSSESCCFFLLLQVKRDLHRGHCTAIQYKNWLPCYSKVKGCLWALLNQFHSFAWTAAGDVMWGRYSLLFGSRRRISSHFFIRWMCNWFHCNRRFRWILAGRTWFGSDKRIHYDIHWVCFIILFLYLVA